MPLLTLLLATYSILTLLLRWNAVRSLLLCSFCSRLDCSVLSALLALLCSWLLALSSKVKDREGD